MTGPSTSPEGGAVLGEEAEWVEDIAHVLRPHVGSWLVARAVADETWQTVIRTLVDHARADGAAEERERIARENRPARLSDVIGVEEAARIAREDRERELAAHRARRRRGAP